MQCVIDDAELHLLTLIPRRMRKTTLIAATIALAACSDANLPTRSIGSRELAPNFASTIPTAPSSPGWNAQTRALVVANNVTPLPQGRIYAAVAIAQYEAVMAIDDADDDGVLPDNGIGAGGRSALEAHRGAVAGASAQVLTFFFPSSASTFEQRIVSEGNAGPGNVHPEFTRGLAIGRAVGNAMVDRLKTDGFTVPFTGTIPTGPGKWIPNGPPAGPTFGGVKPYLLNAGNQFRPAPPPEFGSAAFLTDLAEIKNISQTRTQAQKDLANYWNPMAAGFYNETAAKYIAEKGLDERGATHTFALMHAAIMDALIGCWDAKYFYWFIRPPQADPSITTVFAMPNHPSYPSGHSCVSASAATVLGHLFPDHASELNGYVTDAGLSRMYAGIHYRFDITAGQNLGRQVAGWAIARDESVGLLSAIH